jgi:hypothetical protein
VIRVLGIDPSQRHTGLCLLAGTQVVLDEIKPTADDILSSAEHLRAELKSYLDRRDPDRQIRIYSIEKQLSVGGRSSSLLFYMQMTVLATVMEHVKGLDPEAILMMPLPIQLQSYIQKHHQFQGKTDLDLVSHFKRQTGEAGRISVHKVDAYYLAHFGRDVYTGRHGYRLPTREANLTPWKVTNGQHS